MAHASILIVDDEPDILELIRYNLTKAGYAVMSAASGAEALARLRSHPPDLVVLDLMLPDIVTGLELGADDYLTKPFSPRVLLARLKAVLRRPRATPAGEDVVITYRDLSIHPGRHEVLIRDQHILLTTTEFRILHLLARRPGWVLTRSQIVVGVQGEGAAVTERAIDVHMVSLRRKLGTYGEVIETVRGVGYRFKDGEE
jgi:two-component system, OmpR family, alkaline phosphatase synthesis response regulator PhoP